LTQVQLLLTLTTEAEACDTDITCNCGASWQCTGESTTIYRQTWWKT